MVSLQENIENYLFWAICHKWVHFCARSLYVKSYSHHRCYGHSAPLVIMMLVTQRWSRWILGWVTTADR